MVRFFLFRTSPDLSLGKYPKGSVAFVSCCILDSNHDAAIDKAGRIIHDQGWHIQSLLEDYTLDRQDYADKPEGLEYYEQALIDGEVVVFFHAEELEAPPQ